MTVKKPKRTPFCARKVGRFPVLLLMLAWVLGIAALAAGGSTTVRTTVPEKEVCTVLQRTALHEGELTMKAGKKTVGVFTFAETDGGWSIRNADGRWLALKEGELIESGEPFAWEYRFGAFSAEETEEGRIFKRLTRNVTRYLACGRTSRLPVRMTFFEEETYPAHDFSVWKRLPGRGRVRVCSRCGVPEP